MKTSWTMESWLLLPVLSKQKLCKVHDLEDEIMLLDGMVQTLQDLCWEQGDCDDAWCRGKFHFKQQKITLKYTNFTQSSIEDSSIDISGPSAQNYSLSYWHHLRGLTSGDRTAGLWPKYHVGPDSPILTPVSVLLNSDSAVTSINGSPAVWNHL